ncbi:hypothetical protein ACHAXN_012061 [Cyclotella atomus]
MSDQPNENGTPQPSSSNANTAGESAATDRQPRRRGGRGRGRGGRLGIGPYVPSGGRGEMNESTNNAASENTANQRPASGRRRSRGGRGGTQKQSTEQQTAVNDAPGSPRTKQALEFIADSLADVSLATNNTDNNGHRRESNSRQRQQKGRGAKNNNAGDNQSNAQESGNQSNSANTDGTKKKKRRNRTRRRNRPESRPWLSAIPDGTVDPISLEPLEDLPYPPFALVMDQPYTPVYPGMWPPPTIEDTDEKKEVDKSDVEKDREVSILKAQWGEGVVQNEKTQDSTKNSLKSAPESSSLQGRQFYLFDGFVLAGYLTRTKQFINPYNRRDLTRPELAALDEYMAVHNLGNAGVVQAYDEKGVALSTAGIAGQTAEGRAEILRQEARAIRSTFFQNDAGADQTSSQYRQLQQSRRQRQSNNLPRAREEVSNDTGIYAEEGGGFLMIDDDINPGLRSGVPNRDAGASFSARRIDEQHSQQAQAREESFPSLSATALATSTANDPISTNPKPPAGPSKSLKSITKVVKKTDPAEVARQKKAREEAQRKAELSRLSFFDPSNPQPTTTNNGLLLAPVPMEKLPPTEAVLERNRNFASALGIVPAQMRSEPMLTGWARPTTVEIELDQFGNEINATQYPDSLLAQAKERMAELLKLEKTWKKFLADDKEASCSLKPMDRSTRVFVHEYSDFWRLQTQSYDPEGKRYIHCSKLVDTSVPHTLLSDAAKKWRGPAPGIPYQAISLPTASKRVVPTPMNSPEGWHTEERVPLKLAPRTAPEKATQPANNGVGITRSTSTQALLSMTGEKPPPPRFADLHEERPKLQLAPRTIPPSEESLKLAAQAVRQHKKEEARVHRQEYREMKQKVEREKKQAILESAFASESDAESSGSDWFEGDAAWSDDEGI